MEGAEGLSSDQRAALTHYREATGDERDGRSAIGLLQTCDWSVERAVQTHWASVEDIEGAPAAAPASAAGSASDGFAGLGPGGLGPGGLGAPLLQTMDSSAPRRADSGASAGSSIVGWLTNSLRCIGLSFFTVVGRFIFGSGEGFQRAMPGLAAGGSGGTSSALAQQLASSYPLVQLPNFFEGSFSQALQAARQDFKLLVVYLHSEQSEHTRSFCTEVLGNEAIQSMLRESFYLWGGDTSRMEAHQVAQMLRARQYPHFCVLLPASVEDIRAVGSLQGEVQVDAAVALLAACLEDLDSHQSEQMARREQQIEDRQLRDAQDREYQEALEADRIREQEQQREEEERQEAARKAVEAQRLREEQAKQREAEEQRFQARRAELAESLGEPGADATSPISLRLPAGQRLQRRFVPTMTLADVYAWADCAAHLPENKDKGLEIPKVFVLKTSFPSRELTDKDSTIQDLQLAGSNILLAEVEEDDEEHG